MMTLVIGGAASGKSEYAESLCMDAGSRRAYIATMMPYGNAALAKIARHRQMRAKKGMTGIECYVDVGTLTAEVAKYDVILIECLTNLLANEQFRTNPTSPESPNPPEPPPPPKPPDDLPAKIAADILRLANATRHTIVVTGNVFADGLTYGDQTMDYIQNLGTLNRLLAGAADHVVEVYYGIPIDLKGAAHAK